MPRQNLTPRERVLRKERRGLLIVIFSDAYAEREKERARNRLLKIDVELDNIDEVRLRPHRKHIERILQLKEELAAALEDSVSVVSRTKGERVAVQPCAECAKLREQIERYRSELAGTNAILREVNEAIGTNGPSGAPKLTECIKHIISERDQARRGRRADDRRGE